MSRNVALRGLGLGGRGSRLRVVLPRLVLFGACLALLAGRHAIEQRTDAYAQRLAAFEDASRRAAAQRRAEAPARLSDAALAQLGRQVDLINRDWSSLLASLVPEGRDVHLLGVEVDPVAGAVRITGDGARPRDANAYSALIQQRGAVHDVRLVSLEPHGDRVVFEVVARWRR